LVIGSGPAGVAASRPLVEAGLEVTMVEAGEWCEPKSIEQSWVDFRLTDDNQWALLAGAPAEVATSTRRSAKFSVPWVANIANGAAERLGFAAENFEGMPFAAVGGFSIAWGSGLALFDRQDLVGWPISLEDLSPHYAALVDRIGASGPWPEGHGPTPARLTGHPGLHPTAKQLLARAKPRAGFSINAGLHAVLGAEQGGRSGCDLGGSCLFGCSRNAIWSAAYEVKALQASPRFALRSNLRVDAIQRLERGWSIVCSDGTKMAARYVVCAGGAIGSPRLVLPVIGWNGSPVRLQSSPVGAFALFVPGRLGAPWERRFFGLAQLQVCRQIDEAGDYLYGGVFCGEGIPLRFLMSMMPTSPHLAMRILRELVPACLFGEVFFGGRHL
jgi:choline dehydrogenase-like flavoprotein